MTDLVKEREQAKTYLKVLFGRNEPDEVDIMFMLGLMHANVDIVSVAMAGLPSTEYDEAFSQSNKADREELIDNGWLEKRDEK